MCVVLSECDCELRDQGLDGVPSGVEPDAAGPVMVTETTVGFEATQVTPWGKETSGVSW